MAADWHIGRLGPAIPLLIAEFLTDSNTKIDGAMNWSVLLLGLGVIQWIYTTKRIVGIRWGPAYSVRALASDRSCFLQCFQILFTALI
jgi:hypothetical protein